jgi:hypothetical protein
MNSKFSQLFLALQQRLDSIGGRDKTIRYIDHDFAQLLQEKPPLSYPAVLIDMSDFNFKMLGRNVQTAEGIVKLRLVLSPYSATSNLTPIEQREKGLRFYEVEDAIHQVLQQWQPVYLVEGRDAIRPNYFGAFSRVEVRTDNKRADLRVRELSYRITFEDYGTQQSTGMWPTPPLALDTDLLIAPDELPV